MSEFIVSRRNVLAGAGLALAAGSVAGMASSPAFAEQGNMEAALRQLQNALNSLHRATPNKGGHKERAAELVEQAMAEVQAGIDYAAAHGGG
ncbi:hypothetical protein FZ934_26750 (plasmid) [Rhizobium grahamii]|uniref:Twin-arginine translocation signal domain-containing protein n=1 Tax=Rhizobium grahamii TaxID=1120045 RepID=A0A5Q0CDD9_9HYPH|nr:MULTISPECIES: hypothetical protein [Rhizobium]QFY63816.1 hypothetical protein FZ934_26750 [Rhizobium grahamii]QRM52941.1 hypothetical protein F3Y33_27560 [Rhizobium sp. BG6]